MRTSIWYGDDLSLVYTLIRDLYSRNWVMNRNGKELRFRYSLYYRLRVCHTYIPNVYDVTTVFACCCASIIYTYWWICTTLSLLKQALVRRHWLAAQQNKDEDNDNRIASSAGIAVCLVLWRILTFWSLTLLLLGATCLQKVTLNESTLKISILDTVQLLLLW